MTRRLLLFLMTVTTAAFLMAQEGHRKKRPAAYKEKIGECKQAALEMSADLRIELAQLDKTIIKSGALLIEDSVPFATASSEKLQQYAARMENLCAHLHQEIKKFHDEVQFIQSCIQTGKW